MNNHGYNEIIIYKDKDGLAKVDVKIEGDTLWLTQQQIADLFGVDKSGISRHLSKIFESGELDENSVVAKNATTASDGKNYSTAWYNLDAIIAVGYRVNSKPDI